MRSDERSPIVAVALAGGSQLLAEIAFNARQIFDLQFFRIIGDAPIGKPRQWREARQQFRTPANDLRTELHQLLGETIQARLVQNTPLEQSVAGAQRACVALEQRQVRRRGLREKQVHESPPPAGRPFDQIKILGAENYRSQPAQIIAKFANRLPVETQVSITQGPVHFYLMLPLPHYLAAHEISAIAMAHHLRSAHAAKRTERGHEVNGFQDVGLALGVIPQEQMEPGRKIRVEPPIIAELA